MTSCLDSATLSQCPRSAELSRFKLIVRRAPAAQYQVIWGNTTNVYTSAQLASGVNLAADFVDNPFCEPFQKVDEAVKAKQVYETYQIKQVFHSKEAQTNMVAAVEKTEGERSPLAAAIAAAMVPVRHTISILPLAESNR